MKNDKNFVGKLCTYGNLFLKFVLFLETLHKNKNDELFNEEIYFF